MLLQEYLLDAWNFGHLHFTSKQDFHALNLWQLFSVGKEKFHVIIIVILQEIIKAVLDTELFTFVS